MIPGKEAVSKHAHPPHPAPGKLHSSYLHYTNTMLLVQETAVPSCSVNPAFPVCYLLNDGSYLIPFVCSLSPSGAGRDRDPRPSVLALLFSPWQERFRVRPSAWWGATWSPKQSLCPSLQEDPPEDWRKLNRDAAGEPRGGTRVLAATGSQYSHQQTPLSSRGTRSFVPLCEPEVCQ